MTVALSRHFENLRTLLSCYTKIKAGGSCTAEPSSPKSVYPSDPIKDKIVNLLRASQANETSKL